MLQGPSSYTNMPMQGSGVVLAKTPRISRVSHRLPQPCCVDGLLYTDLLADWPEDDLVDERCPHAAWNAMGEGTNSSFMCDLCRVPVCGQMCKHIQPRPKLQTRVSSPQSGPTLLPCTQDSKLMQMIPQLLSLRYAARSCEIWNTVQFHSTMPHQKIHWSVLLEKYNTVAAWSSECDSRQCSCKARG